MTKHWKNNLWKYLLFLFLLFLGIEFTLRKAWGFGDMVLFQEDEKFEYIAQPNQSRMRFGNKINYNELSMRSRPLDSADKCIVLGFGDSVINGGTLTDQDSLATTIVENHFNERMRFLNVSNGSWGPDNCAGYLEKYGDFNAKMIILFVSSHDAYDNMTFEKVVDYHEAYPEKQYPLATVEVIAKYMIPRFKKLLSNGIETNDLMINKSGNGFNSGFDYFREFVQKSNIPFVVCLHAEREEVNQQNFNAQGKEIIEYCAANKIKLISGLEIGEELVHFRDNIHLNESGQKLWAKVLLQEIEETIHPCTL